jgi:hypothetical protein
MSPQPQPQPQPHSDDATATNNATDNATTNATNADNADAIEKLWAKERYEMSHGDREASSYELHGVVSRAIVETPELISNSLKEFDNELNNQNNQQQSSHNTYIQSSTFRLRFLRAELFNIKKSVQRYCICIELLIEYFGDFALQRQLFLTDLNKDEMKMLKEGTLQILPTRDTLGRRIMVFIGNVGSSYSLHIINKVGLFLIFQILAEDITTQRNGIVSIHLMNEDVHIDLHLRLGINPEKIHQFFMKVLSGAPCRWSAVHMCFQQKSNNYNNEFFMKKFIRPLFLFVIGKTGRKVLRIHSGSSIECEYSLKSFGIQVDDIPLTHTGTVKLKNHNRWIKVRSTMDKFIKEQAGSGGSSGSNNYNYQYYYSIENTTNIIPFPKIQCPEVHCVLFRKNGVAWDNPGNIKFRAFLFELDNRIIAESMKSQSQQSQLQQQTEQSETLSQTQTQSQTTTENNLAATTTIPMAMTMTMPLGMSKDEHVGYILHEAILRGFSFLMYDEKNHWYIELQEEDELRKQLTSALRGHRKRRSARARSYNNNNNNSNDNNNMMLNNNMQQKQIDQSNNNNDNNFNDDIIINNNNNNNDDTTMMDIDTTTTTNNNVNRHQYSNIDIDINININMMDVDEMIEPNPLLIIEPNPIVFTNMDGKRRKTTICCRSR